MSAPESSSSQSPRRGTARQLRRASASESFLEQAAPAAGPSGTAVDPRDQAGLSSSVPARTEPSVTAVDLTNQPGPSAVPAPAPVPAQAANIDASVGVQPPTDSPPHEGGDEESDGPEVVDEERLIPIPGAAIGNGSVPTPDNHSVEERRPVVPAAGARRVPRKRIVIPLGLPVPDGYQLLEGRGRVPPRRDSLAAYPELHDTATSDEDEEAD